MCRSRGKKRLSLTYIGSCHLLAFVDSENRVGKSFPWGELAIKDVLADSS